jgi:hypothetical protein
MSQKILVMELPAIAFFLTLPVCAQDDKIANGDFIPSCDEATLFRQIESR